MTEPSIFEALNDPQMRHSILGHLPIVLAILGVPLAIASALLLKNKTLRIITLICFILLAISARVTAWSGHQAEHHGINEGITLTHDAHEELEEHEEMAEKVWYFALGCSVLVAGGLVDHKKARPIAGWLGVISALGIAGWMAVTAHHGGTLVYKHGVGTPTAIGNPQPPSAVTAAQEGVED